MLTGTPAVGIDTRDNIHEAAARQQAARLKGGGASAYEHHEFTVASGIGTPTSINSLSGVHDGGISCSCGRSAGAFALIPRAQKIFVRNVGVGALEVRWNAATGDVFTIEGGEYLTWDMTEVTDIFFENVAGANVDVRVGIG